MPWITSVGAVIEDSGSRDRSSSGERVVVLQGGDVAGALDVAADELARRRLVEGAPAAVEDAGVADQVLDHRLGVRPIHLGGRHEAPELLGRRGERRGHRASQARC